MDSRCMLRTLVAGGLLLPIAFLVCVAFARLLGAMGDDGAARAFEGAATLLAALWVFTLATLALVQGWIAAGPPRDASGDRDASEDRG